MGKNVHQIPFEKAQRMNGVEWIEHIIPELLCANESSSTYMASQVLDEWLDMAERKTQQIAAKY